MKTLPETLSNYPEIEREFKEWLTSEWIKKHNPLTLPEYVISDFYDAPFPSQVGWVIAFVKHKRTDILWEYTGIIDDIDNPEAFITGFEELLKLMSNEKV